MNHRIFFDTEFIEDGRTIDLISIGMVRDDGATYYAEIAECDHSKADAWVQANVLPHLRGPMLPREKVAADIIAFAGDSPQFWAYYGAYDWVVLCQLFGRMIDLPKGWPMFCRDVKQLCNDLGNPTLPLQMTTKHHALSDAHWTRATCLFLEQMRGSDESMKIVRDLAGLTIPEDADDRPCDDSFSDATLLWDFIARAQKARLAPDPGPGERP